MHVKRYVYNIKKSFFLHTQTINKQIGTHYYHWQNSVIMTRNILQQELDHSFSNMDKM